MTMHQQQKLFAITFQSAPICEHVQQESANAGRQVAVAPKFCPLAPNFCGTRCVSHFWRLGFLDIWGGKNEILFSWRISSTLESRLRSYPTHPVWITTSRPAVWTRDVYILLVKHVTDGSTLLAFHCHRKAPAAGCNFGRISHPFHNSWPAFIYRVIRNECRGFNNLSHTVYFR